MSSYYDQVASPGDEIHVNVPPILSFSSFRFRETAPKQGSLKEVASFLLQ